MKKWAFVSDFDGTISNKDFYWIVIEKYFPEGEKLYHQWKAGQVKDIDFLRTVFQSIDQDEEQIVTDILNIPIDEHVPAFIQHVQQSDGDVYILSAGTDYYIHHIMRKYGMEDVTVLSNKGYYEANNIHLDIDPAHHHYSARYGIDKAKVIQSLKEEYEIVHFAGDSEPDSHPAVYADVTFAKDALQHILKEKDVPYVAVNNFKEIEQELIQEGFIHHG
ncbi:MtnX-like HAD-IB family phosphatase [Pontibacillus litoralis]|uniref:2,3-diketo-5-methylthio-1-phosphopentane phosphatase n=1 Tax=Pontibacillus litoralis JSM 072002 TaxID=1385512 RepID=A0A0A5HTS9_9BACI|nr:MtnX-like HAD-IB family phosphatase [Pontibacillus litoralis]KGX86997.1 2,3-diketo-5-methylthio-1-phosphopentane phosphatase [Pontibacillus litoralis JSM 072002]